MVVVGFGCYFFLFCFWVFFVVVFFQFAIEKLHSKLKMHPTDKKAKSSDTPYNFKLSLENYCFPCVLPFE